MDTCENQIPTHAGKTHYPMGVRYQRMSLDQFLDVAVLSAVEFQVPEPNRTMAGLHPRQKVVVASSHGPRLPAAGSTTPLPPAISVDCPRTNPICGNRQTV